MPLPESATQTAQKVSIRPAIAISIFVVAIGLVASVAAFFLFNKEVRVLVSAPPLQAQEASSPDPHLLIKLRENVQIETIVSASLEEVPPVPREGFLQGTEPGMTPRRSSDTALVRPSIEGASPVWTPGTIENPKLKGYGLDRWYVVIPSTETDARELLVSLRRHEGVELVEYDVRREIVASPPTLSNPIPNDPYYHSQGSWGNPYDDQWGLKRINPEGVWSSMPGAIRDVVVGVIDTGLDYTHQELQSQIWKNLDEIAGNGIDDDQNGFIDDVGGWDFTNADADPNDDHGHGTHVGGIIAAKTSNSLGVASIARAPQLMSLKAFNSSGFGEDSDISAAILYAVDNGADILNMSWGSNVRSTLIADTLAYASSQGTTLVAAAGNDNGDAGHFYPAALPRVITVSAWSPQNIRAAFSNYGPTIDIAAPGEDILSLRAGMTDMYEDGQHIVNQIFYRASGTSMAAPHITGVAALLKATEVQSVHPGFFQFILEETAEDVGPVGEDDASGRGVVDASAAATFFKTTQSSPRPELLSLETSARFFSVNTLRVTVNFANIGLASSGSFAYEIIDEETQAVLLTDTITELASGEETIREHDVSIGDAFPTHLQINIDTTEVVSEYSETNNSQVTPVSLLLPGWPQITRIPYGITSSATVEDLDANGRPEVIVGGYDWGVYVWRNDGSPFPGWPVSTGFVNLFATATANLDTTGQREIIVASQDGFLYAWHTDGQLVDGWPVEGVEGSPTIADLNGDGSDEVLVGDYSSGTFKIFQGNGQLFPGWPQGNGEPHTMYPQSSVADLDNDGIKEIVVPSYGNSYFINVWQSDGSSVPGWPKTVGSPVAASPALVNLDEDDDLEIVVAEYAGKVTAWNLDGSLVSGWPRVINGFVNSGVSFGDVDGDGRAELITNTRSGNVFVFTRSGELLHGWPQATGGIVSIPFGPSPVVVDIDGDGKKEIFHGAPNGKMYAWNASGELLPGWPQETLGHPIGTEIGSSPVIANIDNDDLLELTVGTAFESAQYVWKIPGSSASTGGRWPTFQYNLQRIGGSLP